jgi:hypothetical protein
VQALPCNFPPSVNLVYQLLPRRRKGRMPYAPRYTNKIPIFRLAVSEPQIMGMG